MDSIKYEGSQHQRQDVYSGGSRGGARGGCPPYFWRPEGRKKFFFGDRVSPPYLRVWMTGLPRYLKVWIVHWCRGYQTVVTKTFLRRLSTKVGDVQGL